MKLCNLNKKAQGGNQAAILVIVIAVLLLLFILSISPEERDRLLNDDDPTNGNGDPAFPGAATLFRANPGQIPYQPRDERIHEFAPFNLVADVKAEKIHTKNSLSIKNSAFERIEETLTFTTNEDITSNVLLNFNVEGASGALIIKINGETIFNSRLERGSSPPIHIPSSLLREQNTITFQVSGPGAAFWRYNYYDLRNINIYADIVDLTRSETTQVFNVEKEEVEELKTSELRYLPTCRQGNAKDMRIQINGLQIFSGTPDCEIFNTIPIPKNYLNEGINDISFRIREGSVLIDRARIQNKLEEPEKLIYFFEVRDKYFDIIDDDYELKDNYEAMLDLTFPDVTQKRVDLIVNGKPMNFNTARLRETRNLKVFLQPGTNSIQIEPRSPVTITEIRVRIREK